MSDDLAMPRNNIVILGGSYSGISAAHYFLKHCLHTLDEANTYRIVLVSAASQAMCRPACPRAMIADDMFPQNKLFIDIRKQFEQYQETEFCFVNGTVVNVDQNNRSVATRVSGGHNEDIKYYALVIATGASTPSPLLGLNSNEKHLKESWKAFRTALPVARSIIIAGGGPAGIETAGELGEYLNGRARWLTPELKNPKVAITVLTADSKILPALRPTIAKMAEDLLARVGVRIVKNARVVKVDPEYAGTRDVAATATITLSDGKKMEADLYIPATGLRPNTSFLDPSLLNDRCQVDTNTSTLRVDKAGPRVYAIGDASSYARPAVHNILSAVPVLCANIKHDIVLATVDGENTASTEKNFKEDKRETQMVPIGKNKGVGAAMGWQLPGWLVWLVKGRDYWLWTTAGLWSGKQWAKAS